MKHFTILRVFLASLSLLPLLCTGCMDLFDDEEVKVKLIYEYEIDGGEYAVFKTEEYTYDTTAVLQFKEVPVREGYTFMGWKYLSEIYPVGADIPLVMKNNITLQALWEENLLEGSGIEIIWNDSLDPDELFKYTVSGDNKNEVTFTAKTGYKKYAWWISNCPTAPKKEAEENIFVWDTSTEVKGTYYVMLMVTDENGDNRASSMIVIVDK